VDASNLLKPQLARGELHTIGATTLNEYRKHIEKDAALERRFQPVFVGQPSVEDTISILRGLKEKYEVHHGVRITDAAIVAAARLSHRYIADRFLPDKAIDLIDEAASRLRIEIDSMPAEIDQLSRSVRRLEVERAALRKETDPASKERLEKIDAEIAELKTHESTLKAQWQVEKDAIHGVSGVKEEIEKARVQEEQAERAGDFGKAAELRYGVIAGLEKRLSEASKGLADIPPEKRMLKEAVDEEEVAQVVSKWTGIPVDKMMEGEVQKLIHMEERLRGRVIGQDEALRAVSNAVRRGRAGLSAQDRPIGSFIFLGPTGVGKTETARALAEFLFETEQAMVRIDMSEYMESHAVARLIGAPPGYVGYEEGGQLTEAVRRRPYCVILFDEIEKAHPDVFNVFLQILDDGRLTDGKGRTVDFKNTVVIMTSNIGSQWIAELASREWSEVEKGVMDALRSHFKPEFLNRVDDVIIFRPLEKAQIASIVEIQLGHLRRLLEDRKLALELTEEAKAKLANLGYDPVYGARPLKRAIQHWIQDPLALHILEGKFPEGSTVRVDAAQEGFAFTAK
ncbi:MAG: AAA family ATPase, partial [Candidatus Methylomirabilis sp.]|nr:AAA family ATPase [Deltaproteobacteria bacterium]